MAQLNRDGLAFALGRLYLSRGGSESDLNDVTDSADIVAKLYHLLGGNVATPKGTTMAQLVDLLSTTQGGGGGASGDINIEWAFENRVNDAEIISSALPISLKTYFDTDGTYSFRYATYLSVKMEEDSSIQYTFSVCKGVIGTIKSATAQYDSMEGVYWADITDIVDEFAKDINFRKIVFEKQKV